jgi:hypothetical protein
VSIVYTPAQHELLRSDGLFGRRCESSLLNPMRYPIEIYGGVSFAVDAANIKERRLFVQRNEGKQYARIGEAFLRKELRDGGLATLEARLGLSVARPRLLALVSASGGLAQPRATTTAEAFLLRGS